MKDVDRALPVVFLCAAVAAILLGDPVIALACCVLAGVSWLDYRKKH